MERENRNQNSQPELTRQPVNPKLDTGDIFMAEPGQGEQPPRTSRVGETGRVEEASRRLAETRARVELDQKLPVTDTTPVEVRRAREELIRDQAAGDIQRREMFPRVFVDQLGVKYIETMETDPEKLEQLRQQIPKAERFPIIDKGAALMPDQEELLRVLQSLSLPKNSERGFLSSIKRLSDISDPIRRDAEKSKLLKRIEKAPERLAREAEKKTAQPPVPEPVTEEAQPVQPPVADGDGRDQDPTVAPLSQPFPDRPGPKEPEMTQAERELSGIIEEAETLSDVIGKFAEKFSADEVKKTIDSKGESLIESYSSDLPQEFIDKYKNLVSQLKDLGSEETVDKFREILKKIDTEKANLLTEEETAPAPPATEPSRQTKKTKETSVPSPDQKREAVQEIFTDLVNALNGIQEDPSLMAQIKGNEDIRGIIGEIYSRVEEKLNKQQAEALLEQIEAIEDPLRFQQAYLNFLQSLARAYETYQRREGESAYDPYAELSSLEDVAKFIATRQNAELYGEDGIYPLIDKETGKFSQTNFMIWARASTLKLHTDSPNDQLAPLNQIVLEGRLRAITLYMMVRSNTQQYFRDEKTGLVLEKLAEEALTETWAFGIIRNTTLAYSQAGIMTSDTELPKAIPQLHARSDLTRGGTFRTMLSAPADFEKGDTLVGDGTRLANDLYYHLSDKDKLIEILGANQITQEDFRNALRILQDKKDWNGQDWDDLDNLEGIYNKDDVFISGDVGKYFVDEKIVDLKGKDDATKSKYKKITQEDIGKNKGFYYQEKEGGKKNYLFDKNGNIDMTAFVNTLNFYKENTPKETVVDLVRELVRLKIAQKYGLDAGIAFTKEQREIRQQEWGEKVEQEKKWRKEKNPEKNEQELKEEAEKEIDRQFLFRRKALRINLIWSETTSYEMQRGYGIAARNDTNRRGFDAATKLFVQDYLIRQSGPDTSGPIGIPEEIPIIKTLGTDMWIGLKTESGLSPYTIFENIREIENDPQYAGKPEELQKAKKNMLEKLRFRARAESEFAGNQSVNAFDIFHSLTDANNLDLGQIVTYNFLEGVRFNPKKFEEQINEGFIKPMRYAFSSNMGLNLSTQVRWFDYAQTMRINDGIDEENKERKAKGEEELPNIAPIYKDLPLAQAMFSPQALEGVNPEDYDTRAGRRRIVKNLARSRIAAQLKFHRKFESTGERWGYSRTETFIKALQTLRQYEIDPDDPNKVILTPGSFFSKEDIEWIRKQSGTEIWRMAAQEGALKGGEGALKGGAEGLSIFFQALFKS